MAGDQPPPARLGGEPSKRGVDVNRCAFRSRLQPNFGETLAHLREGDAFDSKAAVGRNAAPAAGFAANDPKGRRHAALQVDERSIERRRSWALTGTPIENSHDDLVGIFEFLAPGTLSSTMKPRQIGRIASEALAAGVDADAGRILRGARRSEPCCRQERGAGPEESSHARVHSMKRRLRSTTPSQKKRA